MERSETTNTAEIKYKVPGVEEEKGKRIGSELEVNINHIRP